eukprot:1161871-Pelagomonas_calceolata.AAC.2
MVCTARRSLACFYGATRGRIPDPCALRNCVSLVHGLFDSCPTIETQNVVNALLNRNSIHVAESTQQCMQQC